MLTPKQQSLYNEYMDEVVAFQCRAIDLMEEEMRWRWPTLDDDTIRYRLERDNQYMEILDCHDLLMLASMIQDSEDFINNATMKKLSENIEIET